MTASSLRPNPGVIMPVIRWMNALLLPLLLLGFAAPPGAAQTFIGGEEAAPLMAAFGGQIVLSEGQIIVGEGGNTVRPGMVHIHERVGGEWVRTATLMAEDAEMMDGFGTAVAVSGGEMLVAGNHGLYRFTRQDGEWVAAGRLSEEGLDGDDAFGSELALSGDVALVGAPAAASGAGAVHLFRRSGGEWVRVGGITLPDGQENDRFGTALALDGDHALIGAPGRGDGNGAAAIFRVHDDGAEMVAELQGAGLSGGDRFGSTVAFLHGLVFVGAPESAGAGAVFAFAESGNGWQQAGRWTPFDGVPRQGRRPGSAFGVDMAATDGAVWVGSSQGIYVFELDEEGAVSRVVRDRGGEIGGGFGSTVTAHGTLAAVGAPRADFGVGQVVVYENGEVTAVLGSQPEEFDRVVGSEVSCVDGRAGVWECSEVNLLSYLPVTELSGDGSRGLRSNDNWGWQDPETGRKYALVGLTDRSSFVDVTDAENPRVVGILMMTEGANGSAWRDLKTFGNHVFIVSDAAGPHGMQIFDLTRLREHTSGPPVFFDEDLVYDRIASAHNVVINTDIGHAYIVGAGGGGETCGGGLHIVDINDPLNPVFAGCFSDPETGRAGTGYTHDAQCVIYDGPDTEWVGRAICLGSNETALSIADVTDPANAVKISSATYPNVAYSHQGWLTEDHRWFYMNDELDEIAGLVDRTRTIIWDVSDLSDPQVAGEFFSSEAASDHNLYIVGNLMYQSNYKAGLRVIDITEPLEPVEVGFFDTVPYGDNSPGTSGAWSNYPFFLDGTVISTGGAEGLFMLRPTVGGVVFQD
ncbi:MAG: choice-of-anchor B family protein [Gemmatimonadales bacterium]|nr:MAG: choice-of-anchor B family protein [Gemmatimonadales bacterium]